MPDVSRLVKPGSKALPIERSVIPRNQRHPERGPGVGCFPAHTRTDHRVHCDSLGLFRHLQVSPFLTRGRCLRSSQTNARLALRYFDGASLRRFTLWIFHRVSRPRSRHDKIHHSGRRIQCRCWLWSAKRDQ